MQHSKAVALMDPAEQLARLAAGASRAAGSAQTGASGSAAFENADGTWTVVGPQAGDATLATHVGDTVPPPVPTGVAATSVDGTVAVTWDGTLEGDVPPDFLRVNLYVDGQWFAALTEAGSALTPPQAVGSTVGVTATSEDDACEWDGTPAHNVSAHCAPVEVEVRDLFAEGRADIEGVRAEAAELRATRPTKVEMGAAIDEAKGDIVATIDAEFVSEDQLQTLATKTELAAGIDGLRTEVSEGYVDKATGETLATKSELEQTADGIRLTAESALAKADAALPAADADATYATKAALAVQTDRITGVVSEQAGLASRVSTVEQTASGITVRLDAVEGEVDDAAKVATNFLAYTAADGLVVANQTGSSVGANVQIKPDRMNIRNGAVTNASFAADRIQLGVNSYATEIDMCRNVAEIKVDAVEDQGAVKDVTATYAVKAPGDMARSEVDLTCLDYGGEGTSVGVQAVHEPSQAVARNTVSLLLGGDAGWIFWQDGALKVRSVKGDTSSGADINRTLTGQQVDILLSLAQDQDWYIAKRVANLNALWHSCLFNWDVNTVGIPVANSYGMGICVTQTRADTAGNWAYQIAKTTVDTGEIWVRQSINTGGWTAWRRAGWDDTGWRKLAGTYDTPVGHEGTNGLYYRKTGQMVSVYINGGGTWGPAITTAGVVLGTLPAGYRPNAMLMFMLAPKGAGAHRLEIYPNGQIKGVASSGTTSYYAATPMFAV